MQEIKQYKGLDTKIWVIEIILLAVLFFWLPKFMRNANSVYMGGWWTGPDSIGDYILMFLPIMTMILIGYLIVILIWQINTVVTVFVDAISINAMVGKSATSLNPRKKYTVTAFKYS